MFVFMKINEVKELLNGHPSPEQLAELSLDQRTGVQKLCQAYQKRIAAQAREQKECTKSSIIHLMHHDENIGF